MKSFYPDLGILPKSNFKFKRAPMRKSKPERVKNSRNNRVDVEIVEVQLTAIRVGVEISDSRRKTNTRSRN